MIRILVVEDSTTVRLILKRVINQDPEMNVVGEAENGKDALTLVAKLKPDVVTMDIFMPVMDGCTATRKIMETRPTPIIAVTAHNLDDLGPTFDVLAAGALEVVQKPPLLTSEGAGDLQKILLDSIRRAAQIKVYRRRATTQTIERKKVLAGEESLHEESARKVLLIGGSAGAPGVLASILHSLPGDFPIPTVVVQHIADAFLPGFVTWLNSQTSLRVKTAIDGEKPRGGFVYLPPEGRHLIFSSPGAFGLSSQPPHQGHRPSIDYLFRSASEVFGAGAVGLLLSGMGRDGVEGAGRIKKAGGIVWVQDPDDALVTGIPGAAVRDKVATAVLPADSMGAHLVHIFNRKEN